MSRPDDRLHELAVVELPVGDVGRVTPPASRLGDAARQRAALVERRPMLAPRPMTALASHIGEALAGLGDTGGPAGLKVAGDVAADAAGIAVAADARQRRESARVLGGLPLRQRGRVA